jgi:hypothetical protein
LQRCRISSPRIFTRPIEGKTAAGVVAAGIPQLSLALTDSRVLLTPMRLKLLLFLTCLVLLQSGCALPPTIDEQSREEARRQQVEKRSDTFAKTLAQ